MRYALIATLILLAVLSGWLKARSRNRPFADEEQEGQTRPWRDFQGQPDDN